MPRKRSKGQSGKGFLDAIGRAIKSSGIISSLAGELPIVGGVAKAGIRGLTGFGAPRRMKGKGILSDVLSMAGLGKRRGKRSVLLT